MTLRTRTSHPVGAGSAPGRSRLSDGRLRHRRARHPDYAALRHRAEALLGPPLPHPAPPPEPTAPPPTRAEALTVLGVPRPGTAAGPDAAGVPGGAARWPAVRERLPVWLQARCAVEPRTVAAVSVVLVVVVGFAAQQYWSARPQPVTAPAVLAPAPAVAPPATPAPGTGPILVDVSGKVRDPGVRRLPPGSRVEDALAAAGGVRPGTDTTGLNRARVLMDGEQVLVGAPAPPPGAGGGGAPGPLSLGTATAEQLDGLPGVGPVLAQHIVDFRTERGGFRSVEELRQVNGIGDPTCRR
ncbi:helix-hairpin-helix domain-containing protein [Streptomyces sp. NBC_00096]|uniref:helix-hairpin-helix domain-containing protein n=1 Tax=Streptomyces sp. NBC_00096 TaxID=2975650 RepID=UPI003244A66C